jgi:thioester reductase-like protein
MLTGATGFVGRFLLTQLLKDTDATIYCLVRAQSNQRALSRLTAILVQWGLWQEEFRQRIVAIRGDLRLPSLGIDSDTYEFLCRTIDSIYHCGTSMNHLETFSMARPANVGAAKELLKLASRQRTKVVNYISTLSVFRPPVAGARVVSEATTIDHERHLSSSGYASSKWVGEKIFLTASERGIPCNIFRLGLVWADTQKGRYDELQREYRILKSCLLSGYGIKSYRYAMAPTPVDYVAQAVVFLADHHAHGQGIFHISCSSQLGDGVFERWNRISNRSLELISFYDWICKIKDLHEAGHSLPVVPLIEYAFSMDEVAFYKHQRDMTSASQRFDCASTYRELEHAGIVAPTLDDDLLEISVKSMFQLDSDLYNSTESKRGKDDPVADNPRRVL